MLEWRKLPQCSAKFSYRLKEWFYSMVHQRSPEATQRRVQRRKAKDIMIDHAFIDRFNGDVVNLLRPEQVVDYLSKLFVAEPVIVEAVPCAAERGIVLSDPKGNGAFQK
jgi:hypothetical protein